MSVRRSATSALSEWRTGFVAQDVRARQELRALLGFGVTQVRRMPAPAPDDRDIRNEPGRQGWVLTLPNGWAMHLDSSDDVRNPRLLNAWRYAATRQMGNVDTDLLPLNREQARRVLALMHAIDEECNAKEAS
jgi:hypothetical protein